MRNMLVHIALYIAMVFVAFIFESFAETIEVHLQQPETFYLCIAGLAMYAENR